MVPIFTCGFFRSNFSRAARTTSEPPLLLLVPSTLEDDDTRIPATNAPCPKAAAELSQLEAETPGRGPLPARPSLATLQPEEQTSSEEHKLPETTGLQTATRLRPAQYAMTAAELSAKLPP